MYQITAIYEDGHTITVEGSTRSIVESRYIEQRNEQDRFDAIAFRTVYPSGNEKETDSFPFN